MFILITERDFVEIFDPQGVCGVYWQLFTKIVFPPLLAAILNFCVKRKNPLISETEQDRAISTKFLIHRVSAESLLVTIWNFCIIRKNLFISAMKRDRAISMKFFTRRLSAEYTGDFSQHIVFPPVLVATLNFYINPSKKFFWRPS